MEKLDGKRNAKLGKGYNGTRIQTQALWIFPNIHGLLCP